MRTNVVEDLLHTSRSVTRRGILVLEQSTPLRLWLRGSLSCVRLFLGLFEHLLYGVRYPSRPLTLRDVSFFFGILTFDGGTRLRSELGSVALPREYLMILADQVILKRDEHEGPHHDLSEMFL